MHVAVEVELPGLPEESPIGAQSNRAGEAPENNGAERNATIAGSIGEPHPVDLAWKVRGRCRRSDGAWQVPPHPRVALARQPVHSAAEAAPPSARPRWRVAPCGTYAATCAAEV